MKKSLLLLFLLIYSTATYAQLKLAKIFTDHAVLQRQKPINVWGWADNGERVEVTFNNKTHKTQADKTTGKWQITMPAMEAGGPYELTIKTKKESLKLTDILLGDVWVCSGQSNMEWSLSAAHNAKTEIPTANLPNIRHFKVAREVSFEVEKDLKTGAWEVCSPQTAGDFTAVGYFFAKNIAAKTNIPIGLLNVSWGGSHIEGWISKDAMEATDYLKSYTQNMPKTWDEDAVIWKNRLNELVQKKGGAPSSSDFKESELIAGKYDINRFPDYFMPGAWDWQGGWAYRGKAFAIRVVTLTAEQTSQPSTLSLGENDSECSIYINGKLIEKSTKTGIRTLNLPANTWQTGDNNLVVKFESPKNPFWFGVGMGGNRGDFYLQTATEKIAINNAHIAPAWEEPHTFARLSNNVGTTIYNGMIAPIISYAIKGAIWYQGENNASRAYEYRKSFPLMIQNWRQKWGDNFPFYFVQLSTFGDLNDSNTGSNWAELREAQTMTLALPNTGMAVTTDVGDPLDIHPTNKQTVGERLALNALKLTYGQDLLHSSPMYKSVNFVGAKATLNFDFVSNGFEVKDKYGYAKGFEIAGDDQRFYFAQAQIEGNSITVWHPKVTNPKAVRYAWSNSPVDANVFSVAGLPLCPFRTDTWRGITEGVVYK